MRDKPFKASLKPSMYGKDPLRTSPDDKSLLKYPIDDRSSLRPSMDRRSPLKPYIAIDRRPSNPSMDDRRLV